MTTSFSVKVALFTSFAVLLADSGHATNFPLATAGLHASDLDLNGGSLIDARSVLGVRNAAAFSTIQAAIDDLPKTGGTVFIPAGTYAISNILIDKDNVNLIGARGTVLSISPGSTVGIEIKGAKHIGIYDLTIDPNQVAGARAIFQNNSWYVTVNDVQVIKGNCAGDGVSGSIYIQSDVKGMGSYVSTYENVIADSIQMQGYYPNFVTTLQFIQIDANNVIADHASAITFLMSVIQDAGDHFRISNSDSFSVLNGDIEGGGVAYAFGSGVHNFYSIGNCLSGFTGTYYRGSLPDQGYVLSDSYQDTYLRNVHSGYERAKEIRVLNDAAGVGTYLRIDTSASGVPGCLSWSSLGDDRWSMYKAADNSLNVKDATTGRIGLTLAQGSDVWDFKGDRFANVKSFSATGTPANNLRGTFVVSEANSRETMTFKTAEPDADYYLSVTPTSHTGHPASGSNRIKSIDKTAENFSVKLEAAPGVGNGVGFDWILVR